VRPLRGGGAPDSQIESETADPVPPSPVGAVLLAALYVLSGLLGKKSSLHGRGGGPGLASVRHRPGGHPALWLPHVVGCGARSLGVHVHARDARSDFSPWPPPSATPSGAVLCAYLLERFVGSFKIRWNGSRTPPGSSFRLFAGHHRQRHLQRRRALLQRPGAVGPTVHQRGCLVGAQCHGGAGGDAAHPGLGLALPALDARGWWKPPAARSA
jgi:hypothetical protein